MVASRARWLLTGFGPAGGGVRNECGGRVVLPLAQPGLLRLWFDGGGSGNVHFSNWWRSTRWLVRARNTMVGSTGRGRAATGQ